MRVGALVLGAGAISLILGNLLLPSRQVRAAEDAANPAFYTEKVQPVLQRSCGSCHGGMNHRGGLNMQTRAALLKGGKDGPAVVPGDPAKSLLVRLMRHEGPANDPMPMPPAPRPKVSDAEIATVEEWVKAGAIMPDPTPKP